MDDRLSATTLQAGTVVGGIGFIGVALYQTSSAYGPVQGHVDGRGLFAEFIIPPIAAIGGLLIAHAFLRAVSVDGGDVVSIIVYPIFGILAILPSIGYILLYSGSDVSKELSTYSNWFIVALVPGLLVAGAIILRHGANAVGSIQRP
jgi:hypothetical protein